MSDYVLIPKWAWDALTEQPEYGDLLYRIDPEDVLDYPAHDPLSE